MKWLLLKLAFFYPSLYAFFCYYRKKRRREEIKKKFLFFFPNRGSSKTLGKMVRHIFELRGSRKVMRYVIPLMDDRFNQKFLVIEGLHFLNEALKNGRGVVLMGGHFGNPYFGFSGLRVMGYDLILVKTGVPRQGHRKYRYSENVEDTVFIDDPSFSEIYKKRILDTLQAGKILNYYGDTREGRVKERVSCLGRELDFPTGMIHLAHRANAAIIPFFSLYRGGRTILILEEPIDHEWKDGEREYRRIASEFAKLLESYFLSYPEQYFGIYGPTVLAEYFDACSRHAVPKAER